MELCKAIRHETIYSNFLMPNSVKDHTKINNKLQRCLELTNRTGKLLVCARKNEKLVWLYTVRRISVDRVKDITDFLKMKSQKKKEFFVTFDGRITATVKEKLRHTINPLDGAAIRRSRIPFHEALLAELKEGNFIDAFEFFKELIQNDQEHVLIKDNKLMEMIFNGLKNTENDRTERGIEILLKLENNLDEIKDVKLHWLIDKIFLKLLEKVQNYQLEGNRVDALAGYFYGKFLSGITERLQEAVDSLDKALEISYENDEWKIDTQPLFIVVSID